MQSRDHQSLERPTPSVPDAVSQTADRQLNCLSVDVEEFFQCEAFAQVINIGQWSEYERRARPFIERIAELLDQHKSRATFFVLGWTVPYLAHLLRQLAAAGHEIACHGENHQHLSRMTPRRLRTDLEQSRQRIEDAVGTSPRGYRAPTFSITNETAWALDVIIEAGFEYDASIYPIRHDRYGIPGAPVTPFWAVAPSGTRILEFPPLTLDWGLLRVPLGGGGYLRLLPVNVLRRAIARRQKQRAATMLYVHPWELDPDQPRQPIGPLATWRHRVNLHKTGSKLERLLTWFHFDTAQAVLDRIQPLHELPIYELAGANQRASGGGPVATKSQTSVKSPRSGATSETT
ncbi:MAG: XrtA system polysaccharide deacetylase [Planctomycetota bacterium]